MKIWNFYMDYFNEDDVTYKFKEKYYASNNIKILLNHISKKFKLKRSCWYRIDSKTYGYSNLDRSGLVCGLENTMNVKVVG
jgi:hypothetical protein